MAQRRGFLLALLVFLALAGPAVAQPESMVRGTVIEERQGWIVIATDRGYTVGELREGLFAGQQPVVGELHSLGVADLWDAHGNKLGQVEVLRWGLDKEQALRWFEDHTTP